MSTGVLRLHQRIPTPERRPYRGWRFLAATAAWVVSGAVKGFSRSLAPEGCYVRGARSGGAIRCAGGGVSVSGATHSSKHRLREDLGLENSLRGGETNSAHRDG